MKYILFGIIAGIITGTGMGGGTILIFLLLFFGGIEQQIAQSSNLIFFIFSSISAIIVNFRNKCIDYKLVAFIASFGIIGAYIGVKLAMIIEVSKLKIYFGYFLLIIAIHEIYVIYKENIKNKK